MGLCHVAFHDIQCSVSPDNIRHSPAEVQHRLIRRAPPIVALLGRVLCGPFGSDETSRQLDLELLHPPAEVLPLSLGLPLLISCIYYPIGAIILFRIPQPLGHLLATFGLWGIEEGPTTRSEEHTSELQS